MFDNTITLPIDGTDKDFTRVNQDKFSSQYRYRAANLNADLFIRHSERLEKGAVVKTDRHNIELVITKFSEDSSGNTVTTVQKAYMVFEAPSSMAPASAVASLMGLYTGFPYSELQKVAAWES